MTNAIKIGAWIYSKLNELKECKSYPLIADNKAKFPFIIYRRSGYENKTTKDGLYEEVVGFETVIVSDNYKESVEIAAKVCDLFIGKMGEYDDYKIDTCDLTDAFEEYTDNTFTQRLTFNITIQ